MVTSQPPEIRAEVLREVPSRPGRWNQGTLEVAAKVRPLVQDGTYSLKHIKWLVGGLVCSSVPQMGLLLHKAVKVPRGKPSRGPPTPSTNEAVCGVDSKDTPSWARASMSPFLCRFDPPFLRGLGMSGWWARC